MENSFSKALKNFTMDAAAGDAIRHLADTGMGPAKIHDNLTYPAKLSYIGRVVYEHLLNNNVILLKDPNVAGVPEQYEFVLCRNEYGKTSYTKVPKKTEGTLTDKKGTYIPVSFGTFKYKHSDTITNLREDLSANAWDYLANIPWPLGTFWHLEDERACEIAGVISRFEKS